MGDRLTLPPQRRASSPGQRTARSKSARSRGASGPRDSWSHLLLRQHYDLDGLLREALKHGPGLEASRDAVPPRHPRGPLDGGAQGRGAARQAGGMVDGVDAAQTHAGARRGLPRALRGDRVNVAGEDLSWSTPTGSRPASGPDLEGRAPTLRACLKAPRWHARARPVTPRLETSVICITKASRRTPRHGQPTGGRLPGRPGRSRFPARRRPAERPRDLHPGQTWLQRRRSGGARRGRAAGRQRTRALRPRPGDAGGMPLWRARSPGRKAQLRETATRVPSARKGRREDPPRPGPRAATRTVAGRSLRDGGAEETPGDLKATQTRPRATRACAPEPHVEKKARHDSQPGRAGPGAPPRELPSYRAARAFDHAADGPDWPARRALGSRRPWA